MCGILGKISTQIDEECFEKKLELLGQRGPDAMGYLVIRSAENTSVILGHTRLSIIDLDSRANQPMQDDSGNFTLVYNGEIYNYLELKDDLIAKGVCFATSGDTEVLLKGLIHYGPDFLSRIRGMFAFGLWDKQKSSLLLGRDQFGIKPLYFNFDEQGIEFSSQLRTFESFYNLNINPKKATSYLIGDQNIKDGSQIIDGIFELPPAHFMEVTFFDHARPKTKVVNYWSIQSFGKCQDSFEQATMKVRELFLHSVDLHLRSDVPVSATLSGGIDSSSIVCAIRHLYPKRKIHTFSYLAEDEKLDESKWINLVNEWVGAIDHAVYASSDLSSLEEMLYAQDEPVGSTSIYAQFLVMKEIRRSGFKVTLDGQGADEYLAGYDNYFAQYLKQCLLDLKLGKFFTLVVGLLKDKRLTLWGLITFFGAQFAPDWTKNWLRTRLVSLPELNYVVDQSVKRPKLRANLSETLWQNLNDNGIPTLLRYADRNAMHHSIEGRVPFLYVELVEYIFSLPVHYLFSNSGVTKHVFREAMRGIVPDEVLDRKDKIGFATPELEWLFANKDYFFSQIDSANSEIIDIKKFRGVLDKVFNRSSAYSFSIWRALNLILFQNSYATTKDQNRDKDN
jgi:asparagine synthase (glutamine-hydrolysing)